MFECSAACAVWGGSQPSIGGLVGINEGLISQSYSTGNVTGGHGVGGLVGCHGGEGVIANCYSKAVVNGDQDVGGLIGLFNLFPDIFGVGSIINSYSASEVNGNSDVGGLVGSGPAEASKRPILSCFWDKSIAPDVNGVGNIDDPNVIGLPTAELQKRETFTDSDWDMINVWDIGENQTYPFLRTHLPGDINKDDQANFRDLAILAENWLK